MTVRDDPSIPPSRRWLRSVFITLAGVGSVAAIVWIVGMMLALQTLSGPDVDTIQFDADGWRAAPRRDDSFESVRLRMVDSFLSGQRPIGKSRDQVVALLGEPDQTEYFREYDMVYFLGPERGPMPIDSEWLVFKVNKGVVIEAQIVRD